MLLATVANAWESVLVTEFKEGELPPGLRVVSGEWLVENGRFECRDGGMIVVEVGADSIQRIEFDAGSEDPGDLSAVLQFDGETIGTGYFAAFAGYDNSINKATRLGDTVAFDLDHKAVPGKAHRVVASFDGSELTLMVDDEMVYQYDESLRPLVGDGHGFAGVYIFNRGWIDNLRVYRKEIGPRIKEKMGKPLFQPAVELAAGESCLITRESVCWNGRSRPLAGAGMSGGDAQIMDGRGMAVAPVWVAIDPDKVYKVSGWFRSILPEQPSRMLFDIRYYDADRQPISNIAVNPVSSTVVLTEDIASGTAVIFLEAADDWVQRFSNQPHLAFGARSDLSDLPNDDFVRVRSIQRGDDGRLRIELRQPLGRDVAAGTGVRLQSYIDYPRVNSGPENVPLEWTQFKFQIAAQPLPGADWRHFIWPGAKYMRIAVLNQYKNRPKPIPVGEPEPVLLFDEIAISCAAQ